MQSLDLLSLLRAFVQQHAIHHALIAFSGGVDSMALLHAAMRLQHENADFFCRAIHINHQLQTYSNDWAKQCLALCAAWDVPITIDALNLVTQGESLEAVARAGRYAAFQAELQTGEYLLLAHHQQDQAETVLLNAIRGSGVEGLAAMPALRPFGGGFLARPFLALPKLALLDYAAEYGLAFISDPSNSDSRFSRNFLRHEIMPRLQARWPSVDTTLARVAQLQQEQSVLMQVLLADKLRLVHGSKADTLSVSALRAESELLQKALLRVWLRGLGFAMPEAKKLQHVLSDVLEARVDANPCVAWAGCEVRRYRDDVYALAPLPALPRALAWDGLQPLVFGLYTLTPAMVAPWLALAEKQKQLFQVRLRQGGERIRVGKQQRLLKKYLQDCALPPWEREYLPLVWLGDELLLIPPIYEREHLGASRVVGDRTD